MVILSVKALKTYPNIKQKAANKTPKIEGKPNVCHIFVCIPCFFNYSNYILYFCF